MTLPGLELPRVVAPFRSQLLKWIGNKQRMAHSIANLFPTDMAAYHEVFLGSGAILGTLAPERGYGSDVLPPLMEIWQTLAADPETVKRWYAERREGWAPETKLELYERARASYNARPNGADLLYLSRSCYGGVIRFRKADGYMSTPCGAHTPVSADKFAARVDEWAHRTQNVKFDLLDFRDAIARAEAGDVVYCDPPYSDSQTILYGAQAFNLHDLIEQIDLAKSRGVRVALSIDGTKKSGLHTVLHDFPEHLFETEVAVTVGRSMLRRFQMTGETLEAEVVRDRLLLTYPA
ncbi:Dam family site-specific DNA-(adenine-N6)-methyltransferase [Microbacterium sp. LCT-H2]|uniref:Dam family site-specific DNA-(adenine-N6)-methyltransferase n=1 Tax=Microbacterium sp. LCT-H2 TaxID=1914306 RepID=UPI0008F4D058|nr:Dam family site-specific DNA-(adenine-N6)-methyltransferase [Microbacterium sp. LCT-H2]OIJ34258.1 DNA methyltransferase [Microbacterium sp. LCT-H2]